MGLEPSVVPLSQAEQNLLIGWQERWHEQSRVSAVDPAGAVE